MSAYFRGGGVQVIQVGAAAAAVESDHRRLESVVLRPGVSSLQQLLVRQVRLAVVNLLIADVSLTSWSINQALIIKDLGSNPITES